MYLKFSFIFIFLYNYWQIPLLITSLINSFYYQRSLPGIVYSTLTPFYKEKKAKHIITQSSINTYNYNNYKKTDHQRSAHSLSHCWLLMRSHRNRCSTSFTLATNVRHVQISIGVLYVSRRQWHSTCLRCYRRCLKVAFLGQTTPTYRTQSRI